MKKCCRWVRGRASPFPVGLITLICSAGCECEVGESRPEVDENRKYANPTVTQAVEFELGGVRKRQKTTNQEKTTKSAKRRSDPHFPL